MWMSRGPPPPLICRRCTPPHFFSAYDQLRTHLRYAHRIRGLTGEELRLYETYPNSHLNAPKTLRRAGTSRESSSSRNSTDENQAAAPTNQSKPRSRSQSSASANPNASAASAQTLRVNEGASTSGANVRKTASVPSKPAESHASTTNNQNISPNLGLLVEQTVSRQINQELKTRLPLLGQEVRSQVQQAVQEQVPPAVGRILMDIAGGYQPSKEHSSLNEPEIVVTSVVQIKPPTPRQRLHKYIERNNIKLQSSRNLFGATPPTFVSDGNAVYTSNEEAIRAKNTREPMNTSSDEEILAIRISPPNNRAHSPPPTNEEVSISEITVCIQSTNTFHKHPQIT